MNRLFQVNLRRARRRFSIELLENRNLMASDALNVHNIYFPEDANNSGDVSAVDALVVINQLSRSSRSASALVDINGDKSLTPVDALLVINYLSRHSTSSTVAPSAMSTDARISHLESSIESVSFP